MKTILILICFAAVVLGQPAGPIFPPPTKPACTASRTTNCSVHADSSGNVSVGASVSSANLPISILSKGAVCDGITDDSPAIQSAVASLPSGGGVVSFPRATCYIATGITDGGKRVVFQGEGRGSIVKFSGITAFTLAVHGSQMRDMTINDQTGNANSIGVVVGNGIGVADISLDRVFIIGTGRNGVGVRASSLQGAQFRHLWVSFWGTGIQYVGTGGAKSHGNSIIGSTIGWSTIGVDNQSPTGWLAISSGTLFEGNQTGIVSSGGMLYIAGSYFEDTLGTPTNISVLAGGIVSVGNILSASTSKNIVIDAAAGSNIFLSIGDILYHGVTHQATGLFTILNPVSLGTNAGNGPLAINRGNTLTSSGQTIIADAGAFLKLTTNALAGTTATPKNLDFQFVGYSNVPKAQIRARDMSSSVTYSDLDMSVTHAGSLLSSVFMDGNTNSVSLRGGVPSLTYLGNTAGGCTAQTDLAVDGATNTKVTSAGYTFVAADVNAHVVVTGGAGWTTGKYRIVSVAAGAATLERSPAAVGTTGGSYTLGRGRVLMGHGGADAPDTLQICRKDVNNAYAWASINIAANGNCSSSASPAVCASAAAGSVAVAASATDVVVNTTAVTANSQILVTFDSSLGTKLGVTCNTTPVQPTVSARTAGTSFTITVAAAPDTNPACFSYSIIN